MIDVICPVLGRPQNAEPLVSSLRKNTVVPVTLTFVCSPRDRAQSTACHRTGEDVLLVEWKPGFSDFPRKVNHAFELTEQPWVLLVGDDVEFTKGWDTIALGHSDRYDVIGTNDAAHPIVKRGLSSTHPLIRRRYITETGGSLDGPGTVLSESYDHNYCERELNCLAQHRGVWRFAPRSVIRHRHPIWRTAPDDETYRKGTRHIGQDMRTFYERSASWEYAGMTPGETAQARRHHRRARARVR